MVDISILTMVYKPTYNWGAQPCNYWRFWTSPSNICWRWNIPIFVGWCEQFGHVPTPDNGGFHCGFQGIYIVILKKGDWMFDLFRKIFGRMDWHFSMPSPPGWLWEYTCVYIYTHTHHMFPHLWHISAVAAALQRCVMIDVSHWYSLWSCTCAL